MPELLTEFLKNLGCSYCQEYEFQENYNKDNFKEWKLFLKEYDMYSAMILYNNKLSQDISYIINKNDSIFLLDNDDKTILKLEFIAKSEDDKTSILVPTDEYQDFYEKIEQMDKKFDKDLNAHYIGTFNIKKCK